MIKQGSRLPASASRPPLSQLRLPSASAVRRGTGRFAGQFPAGDGKAAGRGGKDTVPTKKAAKNGVWRPCWWLFHVIGSHANCSPDGWQENKKPFVSPAVWQKRRKANPSAVSHLFVSAKIRRHVPRFNAAAVQPVRQVSPLYVLYYPALL